MPRKRNKKYDEPGFDDLLNNPLKSVWIEYVTTTKDLTERNI